MSVGLLVMVHTYIVSHEPIILPPGFRGGSLQVGSRRKKKNRFLVQHLMSHEPSSQKQ